MYRPVLIVFLLFVFVSCIKDYGSLRLPDDMVTTSCGKNIDSLIRNHKYTALILYCDHCGKGISDVYSWNEIVTRNESISPLIIIKSDVPKLIETYLEVYNIDYPRIVYDFDTLRTINPHIKSNAVILVDHSYRIIDQTFNSENRYKVWQYTRIYR